MFLCVFFKNRLTDTSFTAYTYINILVLWYQLGVQLEYSTPVSAVIPNAGISSSLGFSPVLRMYGKNIHQYS